MLFGGIGVFQKKVIRFFETLPTRKIFGRQYAVGATPAWKIARRLDHFFFWLNQKLGRN